MVANSGNGYLRISMLPASLDNCGHFAVACDRDHFDGAGSSRDFAPFRDPLLSCHLAWLRRIPDAGHELDQAK